MPETLETREVKLLKLALDPGASSSEAEVASVKLIRSLRSRGVQATSMLPVLSASSGLGDVVIDFGKYRGRPLGQVPFDYLHWALSNVTNRPELVRQIREFLARVGARSPC
jgi:hypothetical protein